MITANIMIYDIKFGHINKKNSNNLCVKIIKLKLKIYMVNRFLYKGKLLIKKKHCKS